MHRRLGHLLLSVMVLLGPVPTGAGVIITIDVFFLAAEVLASPQALAQSARRSGDGGLPDGAGGSVWRPSMQSGDRAISWQSDRRPSAATGESWGSTGQRRPSASETGGFWSGGAEPGASRLYPGYVPSQRFGVWDGLLLWTLLNTLNQPGRAQFFYSNQDDPGYQQWRAQMDAAAAKDASIRQKLTELDSRIAQLQGQPKTPNILPADVSGGVPMRATPDNEEGTLFVLLLLGAGAFLILWLGRLQTTRSANIGAPGALAGSAPTGFRVGMTFPVDPTPFVLATVNTKVKGIDGETVSVEAIGALMDGNIPLSRLYLPERNGFFQLHLTHDGQPDECQYFSRVDEISPGVWLDPVQGRIGWPQFKTGDGKIYGRIWAGGAFRIPPRDMRETIQDRTGTSTRTLHAMLYGAPTGAAPPAPQTEYILVAAVEDGGLARVEISAGVDIDPASLSLPPVHLA